MSNLEIRLADPRDAAGIAAIYAPIVLNTPTSFEADPPDAAEMAQRIEKVLTANYPWLVCADGDRIAGYAYGSRHRERAAYLWSVETTVYVHPDYQGRGVARQLYRSLLSILAAQGYRSAFAGITLPNPASVALHQAAGFRHLGVFERIGYKFGAWHDVGWWQMQLSAEAPPESIKKIAECHGGIGELPLRFFGEHE